MDPIPCYYGSVNRWECDENDHLNVRYYAEKINQAIAIFLLEAGHRSWRITAQHIRFVQEVRIATPLRVDCVPVRISGKECDLLSVMRQNLTDEPVAAFTTTILLDGPAVWGRLPEIPDWAMPRGIDPNDSYSMSSDLAEAMDRGFSTMGRGLIASTECDSNGELLLHNYIARISDGMPNLWAFETEDADQRRAEEGELGGAVLEYRLVYRAPLRSDDVFRQLSGIRAFGGKTQHMVHLMFNETRGEVALTAEAIGIAMDLDERRAVTISGSRQAHLEDLMVR